ncbi:MAG: CPBP family intramembrane metalloprotease [Acidobacteria bacterium]|nr:CPBP family intramembrane metalloprotease [Acidobacteriota bacterium]MCL5286981.1 CPBP family intramembrane metalloprotease [Acidobacteriota bacterium]
MDPESNSPRPGKWYAQSRWLSAAELLLGAFIVIGHNVYKIVPNEVPILFVLGMLSLRLRDGGWSAMGLRRPDSWLRIVLIALAAAALRIGLAEYVIDPLTSRFWPPAIAPEGADAITGNVGQALLWLGLVWTWAAFGEEIAYRGYLLTRTADLAARSKFGYWLGVLVASVLFGIGHYYKGPSGIIDSGVAGLILGVAYMLSGRNLWTAILAHGFIDTVGVFAAFMGWDS